MRSRSLSVRAVAGWVVTTLLAFLVIAGAGSAAAADPAPTITIANGDVAGLVAALSAADTNGVPDVIALAAGGTYTLTQPVAGGTGMGLPPVQGDSSPVTIEGNGATIQRSSDAGTPAFRILDVEGGASLTVIDVTISNGDAEIGSDGGGIHNHGALTVERSTISGNAAVGSGGGIYDVGSFLHIIDSTVSGNVANADGANEAGGGGVDTEQDGDKLIDNSTLVGNRAPNGHGGNVNVFLSPVTITNSTITGGSAPLGSGVCVFIHEPFDPVPTVGNSIIADNDPAGGNVNSSDGGYNDPIPERDFHSQGYNIVGASPEIPASSFIAPGDQTGGPDTGAGIPGVDPLLNPLADNGGPTQIRAPKYGSPAIDAGSSAASTDQRGLSRPVDLPDQPNVGTGADIGAVELQTEPPESLVVTTAADEDNGTSDPSVGTGTSLREAINYSQLRASLGLASTITFAIPGPSAVITLSSPLPSISGDVTLDNGTGSHPVTVQASGTGQVSTLITTWFGSTVTLSGLTFTNPGGVDVTNQGDGLTIIDSTFAGGATAAVASDGNLTVHGSTFTGNGYGIREDPVFSDDETITVDASTFSHNTFPAILVPEGKTLNVTNSVFTSNSDGAISTAGTANIATSTFTGNSADLGGAIRADKNTLPHIDIDGSTFTGNSAGSGGALWLNGFITVTNSTVTGNSSTTAGGGIYAGESILHLASDTITANTAPAGQGGGALSNDQSETDVHNSIVVGNTGDDFDTSAPASLPAGALQSDGYNLIGSSNSTSAFTASGDVTGVSDAKLGPLADNGGPTQTQALLPGSPAVDAGDPAGCQPTDQRGITRPQGPRCDIGAFEVKIGPAALITPTSGSGQAANPGAAFGARLVATVTDTAGFPVPSTAVTFTVTSGSASFAGQPSATVATDAHGVATSPVLTAGSTAGPVVVTASTATLTGTNAAAFLETVTAPATAKADLSVKLTAPAAVSANGSLTATLTVTNAGPSASGRFAAALIIPRTLSITAANGGTRFRLGVIFTGTSLASGQSVTYTITLKAGATKGNNVLGAAAVSGTRDPALSNNVTVRTLKIQ